MSKISSERLEKYRQLADRGLWDAKDEKVRAFYRRVADEGLNLSSNNFSTTGMFRAPPQSKDLTDVDIALMGNPMDIGVPNPRPGTRLGPRELRHWSLDRDVTHYLTRVNPFEICNIIDWGDVEFIEDIYNLAANLEELTRVYNASAEADVTPFTIGGEHTDLFDPEGSVPKRR